MSARRNKYGPSSRYGNPTVAMFEERLRLIEGAEACFGTSSGMSAVFVALAALCGAGDRIVASRALFGSCFVIVDEILPRWGVERVLVDGADLDQWRAALDRPTAAVFFETPSNPMQELVDIRAVSDLAHAVGAKVVVDNVFGTPVYSKPLEHGADIVTLVKAPRSSTIQEHDCAKKLRVIEPRGWRHGRTSVTQTGRAMARWCGRGRHLVGLRWGLTRFA